MLAFSAMKLATTALPFTLVRHPLSSHGSAAIISGWVEALPEDALTLHFALEVDLSTVRIPAPAVARPAEGLWRHSCFEAFVMGGEGPAYIEFNFSPSGEWAVYAFSAYREGGDAKTGSAPRIDVHSTPDRLELEVRIEWAALPQGRPLRLALSAVTEARDGTLSYWALHHPLDKPDFHHPDGFTLRLDPTEQEFISGVAP